MRYIILALLVITGCSSTTDALDEFEPYQIGAWVMTSEESAEYAGTMSLQSDAEVSTDTIYIDSPGSQYLSIWRDSVPEFESSFNITFIDSTVSYFSFGSGTKSRTLMWKDRHQYTTPFGVNGHSATGGDEHQETTFWMTYQCDPIYPSVENMQYTIGDYESEGVYRVYEVDVTGVIEVIHEIVC